MSPSKGSQSKGIGRERSGFLNIPSRKRRDSSSRKPELWTQHRILKRVMNDRHDSSPCEETRSVGLHRCISVLWELMYWRAWFWYVPLSGVVAATASGIHRSTMMIVPRLYFHSISLTLSALASLGIRLGSFLCIPSEQCPYADWFLWPSTPLIFSQRLCQ